MKRWSWVLVALVALLLIAGCGRGRPSAPAQGAPVRPPVQATVAGAGRSEAVADDLEKSLDELEGSLNGVDTIEDLEQVLQGS